MEPFLSRLAINGKENNMATIFGKVKDPDVIRGKSAYEVAVAQGFDGTVDEWLASLKGEKGDKGDTGNTGETGGVGGSYVEANPAEDATEALTKLKIDGKVYSMDNAYALAKESGYAGTEAQFGAKLAELLALEVYAGEYEVIE